MELNKEKDTLEQQLSEYNMEKPRLMKKAKEPKSDIDKFKKLEKELIEERNKKRNKSINNTL